MQTTNLLIVGNVVKFTCYKNINRHGVVVPNAPNIKNPNRFTIQETDNGHFKGFDKNMVKNVELA